MVAVVAQPDRPRGRGRRPAPSPVAAVARRAGVPLLQPEQVAEPEVTARLGAFAPDLGVVVAFGQFLPRRVRELPALGFLINAHASLLPRQRGAAPVAHAILAGDAETGVSVMRVEREMDAGPVALVRRTPIGADETAGELTARLARLAADAIQEAVEQAAAGRLRWTPQDPAAATFAPKLGPEDGRLDWSEPAAALARRVRALAPRPGAWTEWQGERLRVLAATSCDAATERAAGVVRRGGDAPLAVATGAGWLVPRVLQRAGGRALDAETFLRGRPIPDGARLGGDSPAATLDF